jgi:hypothetical protein
MFDRLQKPFLTVDTGEAYQPIRLTYQLKNKDKFVEQLEKLQCIQQNTTPNSWSWMWTAECDELHFDSISTFRKKAESPIRLGTITFKNDKIYISLPSFKRACLAVPFFHKSIAHDAAQIHSADFINKVFALDERLPHGFTELFKEEELDKIMHQRIEDYHKVKEKCELAPTAEAAFTILSEYTKAEAQKRLPYAERYTFDLEETTDTEVLFLAFYIFMRGREMVAIKRWYGQTGYSLADVVDETIHDVFGEMHIDLLE